MNCYDYNWAARTFYYKEASGTLHWLSDKGSRAKAGAEVGYVNRYGYRMVRADGRMHTVHRLIWLILHGSYPTEQLDHIDGDRTNNRRTNLREVNPGENSRNMKISTRNKSGILGVNWSTKRRRWSAEIQVNRNRIHLGWFTNLLEAAATRKSAETRYGFHQNHGRVPTNRV